eukprot:4171370-Pyramimonas_sp.AAC.1
MRGARCPSPRLRASWEQDPPPNLSLGGSTATPLMRSRLWECPRHSERLSTISSFNHLVNHLIPPFPIHPCLSPPITHGLEEHAGMPRM